MKKRIISMLLVVLLIIGMTPAATITTGAEYANTNNIIQYYDYSIEISKSNNYSFYVYNTTGSLLQNVGLTATVGSSVKSSNVVWKVESYPQGMPENAFKSVLLTTGISKNFNELFSTSYKLKNIVPGDYTVRAYVYKDSQYMSASNAVTVNVKRVAEYVDITDESGKVISEQLLEGPYVGGTMKLGCVPGNGASNPRFKSVSWSIESLVGTDVATISSKGVLTANNPGQVKVTATAIEADGDIQLHTDTQYVIINIPITEFEVTLETPVVGGEPHKIASVPESAPYKLDYNERYSWVSGVSGNIGLFAGNLIPKLRVTLVPKDGYVFPARQLGLQDPVATEEWWTYSEDSIINVNGTKYNFKDFEATHTNGYSLDEEYGEFYEPQSIDFYWTWERLIDPSHTYIDYVNLTTPIPKIGDNRDMTPDDKYVAMLPTCTNTNSIFAWVNDSDVYKVSGDYLNDLDTSNDNSVRMEETETYQAGQMYRADIYLSTTNINYTTFFAQNVTVNVNGETCYVAPLSNLGEGLEGQQNAKVTYYFTPIPERETISMVYIEGIEQPVGYTKPVTSIDVTVDDGTGEVYISRLKWFYDENNNGKLESGEDSASYFNNDGSFVQGCKYSVYVELEARDRDGDGESDYVIIPDDVGIFIVNGNYIYELIGDKNGAVYTFAEATVPEKAVKADTANLVFDLTEGYDSTRKNITFTSVGTTAITSIKASSVDTSLINVTSSGMQATVTPVDGLAKGTYSTYVTLLDENNNVWYMVPVTINVCEKINISIFGDINIALEKTDINIFTGVTELQAGTYQFKVDDNGTIRGMNDTYQDTATIDYSEGDIRSTTLNATGGEYTFTYNVPTKTLVIDHKPPQVHGDVNWDGTIDICDVIFVMKHIVGTITLDEKQSFYADINSDGIISVVDVIYIQKMILDMV